MELPKKYEQFKELYQSKYAFDPESETFYASEPESFKNPKNYEDWKVEKLDVKQYLNERLASLGITEKDNLIELIGGVNLGPNERCEQPVFIANERGDIEILQYGLNRRPYTEMEGKRERYVYHIRQHPWHEALTGAKYNFGKAKNAPFWHRTLIEAFEAGKQVETLVITEGQFKAFKASHDGIPTVGLTSISHFKKDGKLHAEILDFIRKCQVTKVVILWDGDCRNISSKDLELHIDISDRPKRFFQYARKIASLIQEVFPPKKKVEIFFATIQTGDLRNEPKGIDDLLIEFQNQVDDVKEDFYQIGNRHGKFLEWVNITHENGIKKMRQFFMLHSVQDFYNHHRELIKEKSFIFQGTTYRIDKGMPVVEISKAIKEFKRIGFDYYRLKMTPVSIGKNGETALEEQLVPWNKSAIVDDYGKDVIQHVERYDGFVNVASHTDYRAVISNHWNLYYNVNHELVDGDFPHITLLLKHIFQEHYDNEMILDYLTLLYRFPSQKLPVVCLVSKDQGTGKSTFIYLLKLIFKQNMAIISNNDLTSDFNSHWTSKLVVASEETLLEKKDGYEKIKSFSTAKYVLRNEKNKTATEIENMMHFVFCSNHENDFIRIDDSDSRLWIRKVPPLPAEIKDFDQKLEDETPAFVNFIANREIKYNYTGSRLYFNPRDFKTEAFYNVARHSEPAVIRELRERLEESFLKWGGSTREMTAADINARWNIGSHKELNYLNKTIKSVLQVDRKKVNDKEQVTYYDIILDDPSEPDKCLTIRAKGRPFVFPRELFVKELEQLPPVQTKMEIPEVAEPDNDDLPF